MSLRESIVENFAGDLEYHPRRGVLYIVLAGAAFCFFYLSPGETRFTTIPLSFCLGSIALLLKGIFLCRKSSEGLGLSAEELSRLSTRKKLPSIPGQVAQVVQDFGAGSLLLWPLLEAGKDFDASWTSPPRLRVFLLGAALSFSGWIIRRLTESVQN